MRMQNKALVTRAQHLDITIKRYYDKKILPLFDIFLVTGLYWLAKVGSLRK